MRYLFISLLLVSCWCYNSTDEVKGFMNETTIDTAAERAQKEKAIIDSVAKSLGWGDDVLPGGIRYVKHSQNSHINTDGSVVCLDVYVDLLNGNKCYWLDSIEVNVGKYVGIKAIDEISKAIGDGDSLVALVPSDFGHGLTGIPGVVPPGAMLKISVSQQSRQAAQ